MYHIVSSPICVMSSTTATMTSLRQDNLSAIAIDKPRVRRCQQAPEQRTKFEFESRVCHHSSHEMSGFTLSRSLDFRSL
jgi:hypothetical protein